MGRSRPKQQQIPIPQYPIKASPFADYLFGLATSAMRGPSRWPWRSAWYDKYSPERLRQIRSDQTRKAMLANGYHSVDQFGNPNSRGTFWRDAEGRKIDGRPCDL